MLFSQRYGYRPIKEIIQIENIDQDLRNGLWDALKKSYWDLYESNDSRDLQVLIERIWHKYFKWPIDTIPNQWANTYRTLRNYFFECEWYEVYDFIEFMPSNYDFSFSCYGSRSTINEKFKELCNKILERENSVYRFVGDYITIIPSNEEIEAIETALEQSYNYWPVTIHLNSAVKLLSDKKKPDYRNSIKESISAVESLCKIVTNDSSATLGKVLKKIEQKYGLHPSLKAAFEKLYGYTNDSDGIRHALLEEPNLKYEDAKYMLVTCSAFINYLIEKTKT